MEKNEMQLVLQDVRKAYCLLADYQQRISELLDFIRKELNAEYYYYHLPDYYSYLTLDKFAENLSKGSEKIGLQFLLMKNIKLLWQRTKIKEGWWGDNIKKNDLVFEVCISNGENADIEQGKCELHIFVYKCVKYKRIQNWDADIWWKCEYPLFNEVGIFKDGNNEYQIYGERFDLAELTNQEAVLAKLNAFRARASEKLEQEI